MRTIKFRVWDKEKGYFNSDYSINDNLVYGYCEGRQIPKDEQSKLVFMQFTGLLDKNGKEIYEGDIVKNNDRIWLVYWSDTDNDGCYRMARNGIKTSNDFLFINENQHSEVVGNLFENPELLEVK